MSEFLLLLLREAFEREATRTRRFLEVSTSPPIFSSLLNLVSANLLRTKPTLPACGCTCMYDCFCANTQPGSVASSNTRDRSAGVVRLRARSKRKIWLGDARGMYQENAVTTSTDGLYSHFLSCIEEPRNQSKQEGTKESRPSNTLTLPRKTFKERVNMKRLRGPNGKMKRDKTKTVLQEQLEVAN